MSVQGNWTKANWLLAVVGLLGSQAATAGLVQFDMRGQVAVASGTLVDVTEGTDFYTSFLLDTSNFDGLQLSFASYSSPLFTTPEPVVDLFAVTGAHFANVQASLGSHVFAASEAKGDYDGLLSSPGNGDDYDLSLSILALPSFSLTFRDFNTTQQGGFGMSQIAADPLAGLALGFDRVPAFTFFSGNFGNYGISVSTLAVASVPEPATLPLFGVALGLLWFMSRRRPDRQRQLADASE